MLNYFIFILVYLHVRKHFPPIQLPATVGWGQHLICNIGRTATFERQHWKDGNIGRTSTLVGGQHWKDGNIGTTATLEGRQHWKDGNIGRTATLVGRQHW